MPDRPNILFVLTDQQSADAMSCAGSSDLRTPAMDRLAARGVRFEKAYCAYPLCGPSRAAMFTGRMPHEVGVDDNGQPIAEAHRAAELGALLKAAGYHCAYAGKWHVPEMTIPDGEHGFERIAPFGDAGLAEACAAFLRSDHSKPFFLVAAFDNPHNICEWARNQTLPWGNVPEVAVERCPNLPANFAPAPYEPEAIRHHMGANVSVYPTAHYTPDDWRRYRHAYFRLVEKVDAEIGRILDTLDAEGFSGNTLIVFSSDHGDGQGAHGWNQKNLLYDEAARVPLIVCPPGGTPGRVDAERLVSNGLDLLPTLCDYAGVTAPEGLAGLSLRPAVENVTGAPWRNALVAETRIPPPPGLHNLGRMVRTARYKYCCYGWGKYREQLFDMDADPGEVTNLAVNARFDDVLATHRRLLLDWCRATGDALGCHYGHPQSNAVPGFEYTDR